MEKQKNFSPSKTGKLMLFSSWIIGILLLTKAIGWWESNRNNPNQIPRVETLGEGGQALVLKRNPQGHYLFNGKANGKEITFIVDTGATNVAVPGGLANILDLPELGDTYAQTAAGLTKTKRTRINVLELGPFILNNVEASIIPAMDNDQEVLLGMSVLKHFAFSQDAKTLTLKKLN